MLVLWSTLMVVSGVTLRAKLKLGTYSLLLLVLGSKDGRGLTSRSVWTPMLTLVSTPGTLPSTPEMADRGETSGGAKCVGGGGCGVLAREAQGDGGSIL